METGASREHQHRTCNGHMAKALRPLRHTWDCPAVKFAPGPRACPPSDLTWVSVFFGLINVSVAPLMKSLTRRQSCGGVRSCDTAGIPVTSSSITTPNEYTSVLSAMTEHGMARS